MTRPPNRVLRGVGAIGLVGATTLGLLSVVDASSHREAPLITEDPVADNTDVYAFVSPDDPTTATLISNWIPFEEPAGGPNFYNFGDDVLYEINVDNDHDAIDDVTFEFRFTTTVRNPNTFLYNTGTIDSLDDPDWNVRQTYTVTRVEDGVRTELGTGIPVPPNNVGPRSTPNYDALANAAIRTLPGGIQVFAGQRDEAFPVDVASIFDLGGLRPFNEAHVAPLPNAPGKDGTAGFNVHSIALKLPIDQLTAPANYFRDDEGNVHEAAINSVAKAGITSGCAGGGYCPQTFVGRDQMATFLGRALELEPSTVDAFTDDNGSVHEGYINAVAEEGITTGCAPGLYCPTATVTRAQMATFLGRALELEPSTVDAFTDDNGSVHEGYINAIAAAGITLGCSPGRYCPSDSVTRAQMASYLTRAFELPAAGEQPVIGVYSTTYRRATRVFTAGDGSQPVHSGDWVQVSRLGNPLVNEINPLGAKDLFNSSKPEDDTQFLGAVTDPELARLITALYGIEVPPAPRNDLVAVFLTGIPGLNAVTGAAPAEYLRLNTSIAPSSSDPNGQNRLGLLGGQNDGFPNGRRLIDDVVDIELRALAGATPFTPEFNVSPNNVLGDGVNFNDKELLDTFPYIPSPHQGYEQSHVPSRSTDTNDVTP